MWGTGRKPGAAWDLWWHRRQLYGIIAGVMLTTCRKANGDGDGDGDGDDVRKVENLTAEMFDG
jgi:hypothetical protein